MKSQQMTHPPLAFGVMGSASGVLVSRLIDYYRAAHYRRPSTLHDLGDMNATGTDSLLANGDAVAKRTLDGEEVVSREP